jgi:hypothetical protein
MKTNTLLGVTAVVESTIGVALLAAPSWVSALLLGTRLDSPSAYVVAQIAGAALFSIGLTCGLVRNSGGAHRGQVIGLLAYNLAVGVLLAFAAVAQHLHGVALWPAVGLHAALSIWCVARLMSAAAASGPV